jgi:glutamate synthase (NADPH/NADH) large chain
MLRRSAEGTRRSEQHRNSRPEATAPIDDSWLAPAILAQEERRECELTAEVVNGDRSLGARLAGALALHAAKTDEPIRSVSVSCRGTAGQSFGAFAVTGMRLTLDGVANDFVGKGLSGGEIILRPLGSAANESSDHVILGNVALYGATAGSLFAAGRAGERFAVRNSGATAVVEGVGDHGCEYMTGGIVVVAGTAGTNFGAGMTGGVAYVLDDDGSFASGRRYHPAFVTARSVGQCDAEDAEILRSLIDRHFQETRSKVSARLLADWESRKRSFLRLEPLPAAPVVDSTSSRDAHLTALPHPA